jgi:hypothetical protein
VNVIAHQAKGVDAMFKPFDSLLKKKTQAAAVAVGEKNILAIVSAQHHMVKGPWSMYSWFSTHAKIYYFLNH